MKKLALAALLVAVLGENWEVQGVRIGIMGGAESLNQNSENTEQSEMENDYYIERDCGDEEGIRN